MIHREALSQSKVLILGYGLTGQASAAFLLDQGAQVSLSDSKPIDQDQALNLLKDKGLRLITGDQSPEILEEGFDFILKNPGIPYQVPIIQAALDKKIPIFTDIELASWYSQAPILAVTGSNGKTTTTALIHQIMEGKSVLGGNIGIPSLSVVDKATSDQALLLETSSFQLAGTQEFKPHIAVITNIYPTHLDYHGDMEGYIEAKLKIAENLDSSSYLVYNYDQEALLQRVSCLPGKQVPFARKQVDSWVKDHGSYIEDGVIYFQGQKVMEVSKVAIPGQHNLENVLAAVAVAMLEGISPQEISDRVAAYHGMPHRIQRIASVRGCDFYNDSKATNITATVTALKAFDRPLVYIGGGLDRGNNFDDLVPYLRGIKVAHLYGQTKHKMAKAFEMAGIDYQIHEDLQEATQAAYKEMQSGQVMLFSPACASWDQFPNYEIRGDNFVKEIQTLIQKDPY